MFAAVFYCVGLMAAFTKCGYMSSRFFFFFFKDFLYPRWIHAAIGSPKVVFIKNMAIVLSVATCFNHGYNINKLKKKKKVYSRVFETRP